MTEPDFIVKKASSEVSNTDLHNVQHVAFFQGRARQGSSMKMLFCSQQKIALPAEIK